MPIFKAVNILTLLLPGQEGEINKVRKLDTIPPDFDDLPWIHKRTDKKYTGYLDTQDTVILMIEMADHLKIYEITCEKDGSEAEKEESDIFAVDLSSGNN